MTHILTQIAKAKRDLRKALQVASPSCDRGSIFSALDGMGYSTRGRGSFAVVMSHPDIPDLVIKIGQVESNRGWAKSQGLRCKFMDYCEWMESERVCSKYALKVYYKEWVSTSSGGTYVVISERCTPCRGTNKAAEVINSGYKAQETLTGIWFPMAKYNRHALNFILRIGSEIGGTLDIHSANVMQRKDGSIVITDPLC